MKRKALSLLTFFIAILSVNAQSFNSSTYIEKTVLNLQVGFSSGIAIKNNVELGGFYQSEVVGQRFDESLAQPTYEESYFGIYAQKTVFQYEGSPLNVNIRTGILNGNKMLIAPSLRYELRLSDRIRFDAGLGGAGIGGGNFRPTMFFGFKFRT